MSIHDNNLYIEQNIEQIYLDWQKDRLSVSKEWSSGTFPLPLRKG
jgi:hypothetical protein